MTFKNWLKHMKMVIGCVMVALFLNAIVYVAIYLLGPMWGCIVCAVLAMLALATSMAYADSRLK